jgi:hypothetical protein
MSIPRFGLASSLLVGLLLAWLALASSPSTAAADCLSPEVFGLLGLTVKEVPDESFVGAPAARAAAVNSSLNVRIDASVVGTVSRPGDPLADGRPAYLFAIDSDLAAYVQGGVPKGAVVETCSIAMVDAETGKWLTTHQLTRVLPPES